MIISIVNHTSGQISDEELQFAIRAINRQISEDFAPYWSFSAELRLEGRSVDKPGKAKFPDLRGDAILYLWDKTDVPGALGYHFQNSQGIPYGFVFTDLAQQLGEPWTVTLSHEALELLGDAETNLLVMGPHPTDDRDVFHWYEMCDAVQAETYEIDGVAVSNFLLPLYFTGTRSEDEIGARNDFLGRSYNGTTLKSFGINPGGYIGFYDPQTEDHETYSLKGDAVAAMRLAVKSQAHEARRAVRYRCHEEREKIRRIAAANGEPRRAAAPVSVAKAVAIPLLSATGRKRPAQRTRAKAKGRARATKRSTGRAAKPAKARARRK